VEITTFKIIVKKHLAYFLWTCCTYGNEGMMFDQYSAETLTCQLNDCVKRANWCTVFVCITASGPIYGNSEYIFAVENKTLLDGMGNKSQLI